MGLAPVAAVIAVMSIGDVPPADLEELVPTLRETFGQTVVIAPPLPLPPDARDAARGQYRAEVLLDALSAARDPAWDKLLGVAAVDLYAPELNFVFGQADRSRGVAVFSTARLGSSDPARALARAATEAVHELGHAYGLSHCDDRRCVMWFSNTLAESDQKGRRFCARHARELQRARD
jgi:archaemetzincin